MLYNQNQINRDCLISAITSMLNVHFSDSLALMQNLDERILTKKTSLFDCSFQVVNGYKMYRKHLEFLDPFWFKERIKLIEIIL
jgi:hypothetical protein